MLPIIVGMNSGFTRLGPFCASVLKPFSSSSMPPMPVPKMQAKRVASSSSMLMPAWASASSDATMAYWTNRSKRRASFLVRPCSVGSKSRTSPALWTSNPSVEKRSTGLMQQRFPIAASHSASTPMPAGEMAPMPVMTTRCVPSGRRVEMPVVVSLIATYLRRCR